VVACKIELDRCARNAPTFARLGAATSSSKRIDARPQHQQLQQERTLSGHMNEVL
jgi:hypothetical protein